MDFLSSSRLLNTSNMMSNASKLRHEEMTDIKVPNHWSHHLINSPDVVNCVAFSSDKLSHNLLAFEANSRVFVIKLVITDDKLDTSFDYELIQDFIIGVKCCAIAVSPETKLDPIDTCLKFAVATHQYDIRVITSDIKSSEPIVNLAYLRQHTDFVNDICFEPFNGQTLASVSDDCTCCLWSLVNDEPELTAKLTLTSAGVTVKWHMSEPNKLLIAEKKGTIRFYDCQTQRPLLSCDCNRYPLLSADWSPTNSLSIACVSSSDIYFWDTSLSSLPIEQRRGHLNGSQAIKFFDANIIATRGRPNSTVRVENLKTKQVLLNELMKAGAGIAWNCKLPILAVGANKCVHIFRFSTII
ncbi:nucleoporin Nup37-like [Oppia nitens]|uniref:nucleoporin Nup37-like n=1 Tax=Oppia nitens TaxID=1686743 RepID=UPI0023DBC4D9|nr:nucleoporin Nup37-like [Oppia nitens]